MADNSFATYFTQENVSHTDDAPQALKQVLERYLGFLAEVSRDIAHEQGRDTVTEKDVDEAYHA